MTAAPGRGYERQTMFPLEIPEATFAGFYGFGPRAGRPPLPPLGLSRAPLFAHFANTTGQEPHGFSMMAARFESEQSATSAARTLSQQARAVLVAEDAPDLADLEPVSLGDEGVWAWRMQVLTQDGQFRVDLGWRLRSWVLNLLSWSRGETPPTATIAIAATFDEATRSQ